MVHNNPCQGLPDGRPCPRKRRGEKDKVCFNHNMYDLCPECSKAFDDERNGVDVTPVNSAGNSTVISETRQSTRSQSSLGAAAATESRCIFDPVLCYVASARETSKKNDISHLVSAYFASELVTEAKTTLWNSAPSDVIGEYTRRQNTDKRTCTEAHVQDIYDAMRKLDEKKCLPCFAVKATDLHLLPKAQPGELLDYSVTERVGQLERKLDRFSETIDLVCNSNASLRDEMETLRRTVHALPPAINIQTPTAGSSRTDTDSRNTGKSSSYSGAAKNANDETTTNVKSSDPTFLPIPDNLDRGHSGNWPSMSSLGSANNNKDDFEIPRENQRRMDRARDKSKRRRPTKVYKGTGDDFNSLKGSEPDRDIYVFRLLHSVTDADIRSFLDSKNIEIRKLQQISDDAWNTKSFKVTVCASQLKDALELAWPKNVCVRRWRFVPKTSKT